MTKITTAISHINHDEQSHPHTCVIRSNGQSTELQDRRQHAAGGCQISHACRVCRYEVFPCPVMDGSGVLLRLMLISSPQRPRSRCTSSIEAPWLSLPADLPCPSAKALDEFGVDYIDVSPADVETIAKLGLKSRIFTSSCIHASLLSPLKCLTLQRFRRRLDCRVSLSIGLGIQDADLYEQER